MCNHTVDTFAKDTTISEQQQQQVRNFDMSCSLWQYFRSCCYDTKFTASSDTGFPFFVRCIKSLALFEVDRIVEHLFCANKNLFRVLEIKIKNRNRIN